MAWLNINMDSTALHMPVTLDILMPQGHGNYKTLYLLHGAGGDHASWLLNTRITDYLEKKSIAVIMPSGNNRCYVNNRYGKDYETFISSELIEKVENWFSVSTNKEDRFIAGMSMGGYGAFYQALSNPDLYAGAFSYSGLLDIVERYDHPQGLDLYPVFGTKEELYTNQCDLYDKVHKMRGQFNANVDNTTHFSIYCGLQDSRLKMSEDMYSCMKEKNYRVNYITEKGGHDWNFWDACIHDTIEQIQSFSQNK